MTDIELVTNGDRLEAGPALDALVCWKVLGWRWFAIHDVAVLLPPMWAESSWWRALPDGPTHDLRREGIDGIFFWDSSRGGHTMPDIPSLSTNIAAAWWVVERLIALGCNLDMGNVDEGDPQRFWSVLVDDVQVDHPSLTVAICRAALKAVPS